MAIKNRKTDNQWLTSVKKLLPVINILHSKEPSENVESFYQLVSHLLKHKGEKRSIEILKQYRLSLQQYVLRQTVTNIPFSKRDKDGFPKAIRFLKPDRNVRLQVMYSMSVIRLIEEFRSKPEYLVDTIVSDSTAKTEVLESISDYIKGQPEVLRYLPNTLVEPHLILSNKAGPNGPASITCLQDLAALRSEGSEELYEQIKEFVMATNLRYVDTEKYESPKGEFKHSRLVLLSDKACKTRVIAIADWWSNICLSGIHDTFMKALKRLPGDVTYFQDQIPTYVSKLGTNLFSSDMTAFTDRFPIELEEAVLNAKYGAKIGKMWRTIVSNRTFYHENGSVAYKVGNPMGLLSSWAVSTFTHHVVKAWCAHKCGVKYKSYKYLILGDDTLDTREDVYNFYKQTIQDLGVSISTSKCTQSKQGFAEFAKRLFSPDGEITGLPVHLLSGLKGNPEQALELVRICRSRGYEDSILGPSLEVLLNQGFISNPKMVADVLRLPETITGAPPLLEGNTSEWIRPLLENGKTFQDRVLAIAREHLFWNLIEKINLSRTPKNISPVEIENHHPLVFSLYSDVDRYMPDEAYNPETGEEDEYYIYNQWMEGNYQHLCNLPSVDVYKYYNRGHKNTKCKFDIATTVIKISNGDCNIPLTFRKKYSDLDLYNLALESITPKLDQIPK